MNRFRGLKNGFAADVVAALFNGCTLYQFHVPTEYPAQLLLHARHIEKGMACLRVKPDQHIHLAVGAEVLTYNGAEEGQFSDLPATAEAVYLGTGNVDVGAHFTEFRL